MKSIHFLFMALLLIAIINQCNARRVIFYTKNTIKVAHLFGTSAAGEICRKCFDKDHRGRCRRIVSFIQTDSEGC